MQFFSRSTGTGISALGAVLVLCGAFLPTYSSGAYEPQYVPVLALLVAPALLVLVSSVFAWFRPLPWWLVLLCLIITITAFVLRLLGSLLAAAFACFDVCPPGGVHLGSGFWLPLVGFLLCTIGVAVAAATQKRRTLPDHPATAP
jgi:uncharacterized membrane protein